jgi:CRISPR-associated protein Cmr3
MPIYTITPQDVLFFRDGRPMTANAGSGGHGARWPEPSVIFDALHAALHRAFPSVAREGLQPWEHTHFYGRNGHYPVRDDDSKRAHRFGSLATAGPFPVLNGAWHFPCPADVTVCGATAPTSHPAADARGTTNLPKPTIYPVLNESKPDKYGPRRWWNKAAIERYLGVQTAKAVVQLDDANVYATEWNTGIEIDPETQATGYGTAKGKIYAAQYLRLRTGVNFGLHAQMLTKTSQPGIREALQNLFPADRVLICGGQQRVCKVEVSEFSLADLLPHASEVRGHRVKWVLLSPSVFPAISDRDENGNPKTDREGRPIVAHPGGWLPTWIHPKSGHVLLKKGDTRRGNRSREDWRKHVRALPSFDCRLVAACIPKPITITGWSERLHLINDPLESEATRKSRGARATCLAVAPGAVYYFEGSDAPALTDALSWHGANEENPNRDQIVNRRSTLFGEKGFGLGICGSWDFYGGTSDE